MNINEETVCYIKFHSLHEGSTRSGLVLENSSKGGLGGSLQRHQSMKACERLARMQKSPPKKQKLDKYLGSDLVSALTGL